MNPSKLNAEIERIRREYERRGRQIPENYYSAKNPANRFIYAGRLRTAKILLEREKKFPLRGRKILEIGCGGGGWLPDFEKWGADPDGLYGIDLDESRIAEAKRRLPGAELRAGEASRLPWPSHSFDIVLQSTVFSSILMPELRQAIAVEMMRVLKPGGLILWYDFFWDNPWNSHVRGVGAREIKQLFASCRVELERITPAPPLLRVFAARFGPLCHFLERLKFLNTHYLAGIAP